jgi:hypothetical protein
MAMTTDDTTRWTVTVSKQTDIALRSFLAQRGMKKGDLSKFIEDAVRWRVFDQTVREVRDKFADLPPDELQAMIDEACASVRTEMFQEPAHRQPDA